MEKDFNIFLKKTEKEIEEMPVFKEYAIDFKTGEYIKDENDIKVSEKNEALKVWIFKALKTERFRYTDVHSDNYGSELETNIGTVYQKSVKDALMINQIRELRNNFLDNLKNPLSKMEGTFNFDIAATFGITAEEVYKELEFWEKQTFIDTATEDEYVDKHALMFGVKRRSGTKAKGVLKVTGKANSIIEENTIFLNRDGIKYKSLRKEYLSTTGVAEIEIECLSEGKIGNAAIGEITTFEIQNSNIYSVINEKEIINGYDKEPNSVLVARAKEKATRPAHSGNIYDYEQWAKQVDGVGKVLVKPLWNGNGTVKVLIANYNNDIADSSLIQKVRERIQSDDGRPVGADVTVESFRAKAINIEVNTILKSGYTLSDVKEKIESLLKAVIKTGNATFEKANKTILSINRLEKSILEIDGVNDNFVKVNNSNSNLEIAEDEILIVGTVIINEQ